MSHNKPEVETGPPTTSDSPTNIFARTSKWLGIASWALLLLGFLLYFPIFMAPFTSVLGIILGHVGLYRSNQMNNTGRRQAITGLKLNYSLIVLFTVALFTIFHWIMEGFGRAL